MLIGHDLMRFIRKRNLDFVFGAIWGGVIVAALFWAERLI